MKIKLQIAKASINEPCHEDWNKMLPEQRGKFCLSCKKAVYDFTTKTSEEIFDFFQQRKFQTACVRVNSDVLQQPILLTPAFDNKKILKRLAWFAYALYLVFGSLLFSCNTANQDATSQTEYVYDGKTFGTPREEIIQNARMKLKEDLKASKNKDHALIPIATSSLLPDTVELPNVNVIGANISQCTRCTAGRMSYSVCNIEIILNDSIARSDSVTTKNTALDDELSIFPNPSNGQFQIHYRITQASPLEIFVFNLSGQFTRKILAVNEMQQGEYTEQVDLTDAPAGIYFVRIQMKDNSLTRKVIITH